MISVIKCPRHLKSASRDITIVQALYNRMYTTIYAFRLFGCNRTRVYNAKVEKKNRKCHIEQLIFNQRASPENSGHSPG